MVNAGSVVFKQDSNEWCTPQWLYDLLDAEFQFQLDPAATDENTMCDLYYTATENGLKCPWKKMTAYVNPPYSPWQTAYAWVEKCYKESQKGSTVVMLLPSRTSNKWFHDFVMNAAEIRFLRERLHFSSSVEGEDVGFAPFPSMIVVFRPGIHHPMIGRSIYVREQCYAGDSATSYT